MGLRNVILSHLLILFFISCDDTKKESVKEKEINIPTHKFAFKELTPCENTVLTHLLKKDVENLIPYLSAEFTHVDPLGESISKPKLIAELRSKKGFWYELLISAKQPNQFENENSPNLSIPEFSVSDMLGRGNISFDFTNSEQQYRDVIAGYKKVNLEKKNREPEYYFHIKFEVFSDKHCELYGVGIAWNPRATDRPSIAAEGERDSVTEWHYDRLL